MYTTLITLTALLTSALAAPTISPTIDLNPWAVPPHHSKPNITIHAPPPLAPRQGSPCQPAVCLPLIEACYTGCGSLGTGAW